jgi:ferredoxin-NADP reductase
MLQSLARAQSEREVWWVHGARNGAEHAFKEEVDHLLGELPHAHRFIAYSRPGQEERPGPTFDAAGRLDGAKLDAAGIPLDADYYLCGPDGFTRDLSASLTARGVPPERVATETFGVTAAITPGIAQANRPLPHQPAGQAGDGPSVTFTRSNLTVPWNTGYASLLELAEACDVPVSYGCRAGVCHYCETGILAGDAVYTATPLEPPGDGRILVCCAQPASEVALEL